MIPVADDLGARVALVTGANHGIGAATATALGRAGARVLATSWRVDDPADAGTPDTYRRARRTTPDAVVAEIRASGGFAVAMEADLADPETPRRLFDFAEREIGRVEILVNNASAWVADTFKPASEDRLGRALRPVSVETIDRVFSVDARAAALLIAEFARRHVASRATWGRIVSLSSGGPLGFPEEVSYGAAKAALENYTMSAALELAQYGVTANVVHPPVTDTGWVTEAIREAVEKGGGRVASASEVAEVILMLVSDQARLINANVLRLR